MLTEFSKFLKIPEKCIYAQLYICSLTPVEDWQINITLRSVRGFQHCKDVGKKLPYKRFLQVQLTDFERLW